MATGRWSGIRAKLETDYLAPSLRGRIQYFATSYSKCPDHEGRAAVRLDGIEILKSSYYERWMSEAGAACEAMCRQQGLSATKRYKAVNQAVLDGGDFDQIDFYEAFREFDNQSITVSLNSRNPIVRLFALLDRRVGKRKLTALKNTMEEELSWLSMFYHIRLEAEGMEGPVQGKGSYPGTESIWL